MTSERNIKTNEHLEALLLVLDEHTAWFHKVTQALFYAELDDVASLPLTKPASFAHWFVQANREENGVQAEVVEKLSALHSDLFRLSDQMFMTVRENRTKPQYKDYKNLLTVYEEFSLYIRNLEKDLVVEECGYDLFSGLRSRKMIHEDFMREMDRLARHGRSFCVAMARIDRFDLFKTECKREEIDGFVKLISGLIKLSVRSFDDAYYLGDNEFLLCLKQADVSGGIAALERLRKELERQNVHIETSQGSIPLGLSCCIAEPVEGDELDDLIVNLRSDLDKNASLDKSDSVLQYYELSPLQRYIQQGDGAV